MCFVNEIVHKKVGFILNEYEKITMIPTTALPLDEARALRETLIQYAVITKDHTVSDTFVQLLCPREVLNLTGQTL